LYEKGVVTTTQGKEFGARRLQFAAQKKHFPQGSDAARILLIGNHIRIETAKNLGSIL
jgi:hypothetical protein